MSAPNRKENGMLSFPAWLVLNPGGEMRLYRTRPRLSPREIAMRLEVEVPGALFRVPTLAARIEIPPEAATPPEITAECTADAAEAIRRATGLEVQVSVVPAPEEPVDG